MIASQKPDKSFLAGTTLTTSTLARGRLATALTLLLARQSWVKTLAPLAQPAMLLMMTLPTSALPSLGEASLVMLMLLTCSVGHQCLLLLLVNSQVISLVHWQHLLPPLLPQLTSLEDLLLHLLLHKL